MNNKESIRILQSYLILYYLIMVEYVVNELRNQCLLSSIRVPSVSTNACPSETIRVNPCYDEMNPVARYLSHEYTDMNDTTVDTVINRAEPNYRKGDDGKGIRGRLSDIVKVYTMSTNIEQTYNFDTSDRRVTIDNQLYEFE